MIDVMFGAGCSTLTPQFILTLDSKDIAANISDRLINLSLTNNWRFEVD